jgi:hypothetical protein
MRGLFYSRRAQFCALTGVASGVAMRRQKNLQIFRALVHGNGGLSYSGDSQGSAGLPEK